MQCGRHICSEACANNVKYMYANASGNIAHSGEFI